MDDVTKKERENLQLYADMITNYKDMIVKCHTGQGQGQRQVNPSHMQKIAQRLKQQRRRAYGPAANETDSDKCTYQQLPPKDGSRYAAENNQPAQEDVLVIGGRTDNRQYLSTDQRLAPARIQQASGYDYATVHPIDTISESGRISIIAPDANGADTGIAINRQNPPVQEWNPAEGRRMSPDASFQKVTAERVKEPRVRVRPQDQDAYRGRPAHDRIIVRQQTAPYLDGQLTGGVAVSATNTRRAVKPKEETRERIKPQKDVPRARGSVRPRDESRWARDMPPDAVGSPNSVSGTVPPRGLDHYEGKDNATATDLNVSECIRTTTPAPATTVAPSGGSPRRLNQEVHDQPDQRQMIWSSPSQMDTNLRASTAPITEGSAQNAPVGSKPQNPAKTPVAQRQGQTAVDYDRNELLGAGSDQPQPPVSAKIVSDTGSIGMPAEMSTRDTSTAQDKNWGLEQKQTTSNFGKKPQRKGKQTPATTDQTQEVPTVSETPPAGGAPPVSMPAPPDAGFDDKYRPPVEEDKKEEQSKVTQPVLAKTDADELSRRLKEVQVEERKLSNLKKELLNENENREKLALHRQEPRNWKNPVFEKEEGQLQRLTGEVQNLEKELDDE